ncbi:hypothetical protein F2P56_003722 [Juglans regia]|uniref:Protein FAR1-RELATED SEQUENCE n=1 Tax=Juglans regia TaxID=51240 RepID=A0A833Y474_JUGRE|nr:hypothetical protein F2P56_003722 [Juglans regia]
MPFAPFVSVNYHSQSILFGCGLISNEDAHTFEWLFKSWLKCMNDRPPNAIITDQDKVMQLAIARVFPSARHRFCLWHIMKKLPEKFWKNSQYDEIKTLRRKAENEAIADFNSFNTEISYISRYPIEKQFQKTYTITKFKEVQEVFRGFLYLTTSYLRGDGAKYTYVVADEIEVSDEFLKRVNYIVSVHEEDPLDITCSCKLFEFRRILCRHALRILAQLGKSEVPPKYILDRWRKDIKRKYIEIKSSYETTSNPERQRYDRIQTCFYQLCSNAAKIERNCVKLIGQLEQLKLEYPDDDTREDTPTTASATPIDGSTGKVLSLLVVRSKGKPTTKRRTHPIEKALKKSSTKRRLPTFEKGSHLSREDTPNYNVSGAQHEAPQTQLFEEVMLLLCWRIYEVV